MFDTTKTGFGGRAVWTRKMVSLVLSFGLVVTSVPTEAVAESIIDIPSSDVMVLDDGKPINEEMGLGIVEDRSIEQEPVLQDDEELLEIANPQGEFWTEEDMGDAAVVPETSVSTLEDVTIETPIDNNAAPIEDAGGKESGEMDVDPTDTDFKSLMPQSTDSVPADSTQILLNRKYTKKFSESFETARYKLVTSKAGRLTVVSNFADLAVKTSFEDYAYITCTLYDKNGKPLSDNEYLDLGSTETRKQCSYTYDLTRGTYYLEFHYACSLWSSNRTGGSYTFTCKYVNAKPTFEEKEGGSNNSIKSASAVSLGRSYRGQIALNDACDIYKLTVPSAGRLTCTVKFGKVSYVPLTLYNAKGQEIASYLYDPPANGSQKAAWSCDVTKGKYYIKIEEDLPASNGPYSFTLTHKSARAFVQESQGGSNNSRAKACSVSLNKTYREQLAINDRSDYYKIVLPDDSKLTISGGFNSFLDVTVRIYNKSGKRVRNHDFFLDDTYSFFDSTVGTTACNLARGTYYVQVACQKDYFALNEENHSGDLYPVTGPYSISFKVKPDVKYKVHRQTFGDEPTFRKNGATSGTTGQSKRLEAIWIALGNRPATGSILYRTHIQTYGWEKKWAKDGAKSGTSGKSKRLEAIQIKLTGDMQKQYDVYYRVHAQHFGWMGWAKNGASAGTAGYSYRLEAIQIRLVRKGGSAPGSTQGAFRQR